LWGDAAGVYGQSDAVHGMGLFGKATFVSGVGANYGVVGQSDSLWGYGVYGHAASPSGINFGVVGESESSGGYGVVARNSNGVALKVEGTGRIQSDADTYLFIPGTAGHGEPTDDNIIRDGFGMTVRGGKDLVFPLTLPAVLYGQPTILKSVEIFYNVEDPDNGYISDTYISELKNGTPDYFISDHTARISVGPTSYVMPVNRYLSNAAGFYAVEVTYNWNLTGETHFLHLFGIKVRLGHK